MSNKRELSRRLFMQAQRLREDAERKEAEADRLAEEPDERDGVSFIWFLLKKFYLCIGLRDRLVVGRRTLDAEAGVRIPVPQLCAEIK